MLRKVDRLATVRFGSARYSAPRALVGQRVAVAVVDGAVVLRHGDRVFHTYSAYGRGTEPLTGTYQWLDLTARGRQEDWELEPRRGRRPLHELAATPRPVLRLAGRPGENHRR